MDVCSIVILGATGDLAKRKLIPAIYHLLAEKKLEQCIIIGAAHDALTTEQLLQAYRMHIATIDESVWKRLTQKFFYQKLDFNSEADFFALQKTIKSLEKKYKIPNNRLIYLAAASQFFCAITRNLAHSECAQKTTKKSSFWHRLIYEKPFGYDLHSAHEINECIAQFFNEEQIYRIDHYLTKELVSNIALIRFTNCVFEPLWNNRFIDNVQIIMSEDTCIQERGSYYDQYGALKDMVQNHMLELLALIGMETPEKLTGDYVALKRAEVLSKVKIIDVVKGQYLGYQKLKGIQPHSKTETFAAVYAHIDNYRWSGVPFYLKTGKYLNKHETVIHIKFKQVDCLLARNCPSDSNYLTIQIAPESSFWLSLNAKKPGSIDVIPVKMEFCHSCLFGPHMPQAYEILLEEIIKGERSIAVRFDEIEYAWKTIEQINQLNTSTYVYEPGSEGPKELIAFNKKHGIRWRS